jgi:hypothetical protein
MSRVGAIFNIQSVLQNAKKILGTQNNILFDTMDWRPWVGLELGFILNDSLDYAHIVDEDGFLGTLNLPTDIVNMAREEMRRELVKLIHQAFGPVRSSHDYEFDFLNSDVLGCIYDLRIVDNGDKRLLRLEREEKEQQLWQDHGGYMPQRMCTSY